MTIRICVITKCVIKVLHCICICIYARLSVYGKCLKFRTHVACPKRPRLTGQTQIRLLLQKQSGQGLPCYLSLTSNL